MNIIIKIQELDNLSTDNSNKYQQIIATKNIREISVLGRFIALRNQKHIYVYQNSVQFLYKINLSQRNHEGYIKTYYCQLIKVNGAILLLVAYSDKIVVYKKTRIISIIKFPQTLQTYDKFYYDQKRCYFCLSGTTYSSDFTIIYLCRLFSEDSLTPQRHLLSLGLNYRGIYQHSGCLFPNLTNQYLKIHQIVFYISQWRQHYLFLYNKEDKELYLCDLIGLFQTYGTKIDLKTYNNAIHQTDTIQNLVPFQNIVGVYLKVKAEQIAIIDNFVILEQQIDPISKKRWKEVYKMDMQTDLRFQCIK